MKMTSAERWRLGLSPAQRELRTATINCLRGEFGSDFTPEMVATKTEPELLRIPNFGRLSLLEVRDWLKRRGFDIYQPPRPANPETIKRYTTYLQKHGWTVIPPNPSGVAEMTGEEARDLLDDEL